MLLSFFAFVYCKIVKGIKNYLTSYKYENKIHVHSSVLNTYVHIDRVKALDRKEDLRA